MLIIDSSIFVRFLSFSYLEACFQNILLPFHETKTYRRTTNQCFNGTLNNLNTQRLLNIQSVRKLNLVSILIRQHNFQCSQTGCICFTIGHHKFYVFLNYKGYWFPMGHLYWYLAVMIIWWLSIQFMCFMSSSHFVWLLCDIQFWKKEFSKWQLLQNHWRSMTLI